MWKWQNLTVTCYMDHVVSPGQSKSSLGHVSPLVFEWQVNRGAGNSILQDLVSGIWFLKKNQGLIFTEVETNHVLLLSVIWVVCRRACWTRTRMLHLTCWPEHCSYILRQILDHRYKDSVCWFFFKIQIICLLETKSQCETFCIPLVAGRLHR